MVLLVPEHAGMFTLPVDRKSFVDLYILARFDAATAEDALVGVVTIEGVGVILLVGLVGKGDRLVTYLEDTGRVVNRAVLVVVVADSAIKIMILKNAIERFTLRRVDKFAGSYDFHAGSDRGPAGACKSSVDLHHAGITAFDRAHLRDIADLRKRFLIYVRTM